MEAVSLPYSVNEAKSSLYERVINSKLFGQTLFCTKTVAVVFFFGKVSEYFSF